MNAVDIIVITKDLDPPSESPPEKLKLSTNQYQQIEQFTIEWEKWLESQFPEKSRWDDKIKKILNLKP